MAIRRGSATFRWVDLRPVAEHPVPRVREHKTIGIPCPRQEYERLDEIIAKHPSIDSLIY